MVPTADSVGIATREARPTALEILDIACDNFRGCDEMVSTYVRPDIADELLEAHYRGFYVRWKRLEPPGFDPSIPCEGMIGRMNASSSRFSQGFKDSPDG